VLLHSIHHARSPMIIVARTRIISAINRRMYNAYVQPWATATGEVLAQAFVTLAANENVSAIVVTVCPCVYSANRFREDCRRRLMWVVQLHLHVQSTTVALLTAISCANGTDPDRISHDHVHCCSRCIHRARGGGG